MFFFRCCKRVDCGCQSEPEAEVSRSSTCDYSQRSDKQIQRRLLPQPVVSSGTKHFADYSGCSQTTASRSLLVDSTHNVDYEEVLCISVPTRTENEELTYSRADDSVICKPPRSIGIVNNNFSADASSSNNNILQPETSDNEKLLQGGGRQNESESDENSDVSSASSTIDDHTSAEVKYVADIRQFRPTQTSIRPHGDDCCCASCQSDEGFDRTEDAELIHHSSDVKCSCKSCRDFHCRMQSICTTAGFSTTAGNSMFNNQYRLMSCIAQDAEDISFTWSQSASKSSVVYKILECPSFTSHDNIQAVGKASVSANHSSSVFRVSESEEIDDDDGLFCDDDELRYVFHKFIDDSYLQEPFTDVSADDRLRPDAVVQLESGAELECTSARSADDLEVAFFMVGSISPCKPSDGAFVAPSILASVDVSTVQQTALLADTAAPLAELTAHLFDVVTEPSSYRNHDSLSTVENDSKPCSLNVVSEDVEPDTFANIFEMTALDVTSESLSELENMSGVLGIEPRGLETDIFVNSSLKVLSNESQESDRDKMRRDVIVQNLGDNSSFFIELPAMPDEHVTGDDDDDDDGSISISPSAHTDGSCTTQELAPAEDEAVVGHRVEIVTPECITEHPVLIDEVNSSQTADDISYGHSRAADVASYICDVVADAVQQIADDASAGLCNVQDQDISSEWPKQILITSAPLPGSSNLQWATEDEYDRHFDDLYLPKLAEDDTEPQFAIGGVEYGNVGNNTIGIGVLDDVDISRSNEAVCMTDIQAQEVSQVEHYLISYDSYFPQQPIDHDVDRMPIWSSHSACPDETDTGLCDLVQPLEHVVSENEQDVVVASELNLDSEEDVTGRQGADQATFAVTDIVEDFFMQYVLPVDSVGYGTKTDSAAAVDVPEEQFGEFTHLPKVDQDEEDLVLAKELENTAQNILDVVISDAIAEANAATSAVVGAQYEDVLDRHVVDRDLEDLVQKTELETTAKTLVDVAVSDAVAETDVDMSDDNFSAGPALSPVAARSDTLSVSPTRSSCLLHSTSESLHKKSVHFADMHGLQLETVQHYDQAPDPEEHRSSLEEFLSKLAAAAAERRAKWMEHRTSPVGSWLCSSSVYLLACFELPGSQEELLERVRHCRVALESCSFDDLALAISGVVRVANIAFNKMLLVRYSIDHWLTRTDIDGEYIPRSNDGTTDRFSFAIILPSGKQFVIGSEVEFAICYVAGDFPSFEFWDNNHGRNYVVRYCSKAASSDAKNVNLGADDVNKDNDDSD